MDAPFLIGQAVRVARVPHECMNVEIGHIEIVIAVVGELVWCRPAVLLTDGTIGANPTLRFQIARRRGDLQAYTCA